MKRFLTTLLAGAVMSASAQNYAAYNKQPVARVSFLRSQWAGKNVLGDSSLIAYWPLTKAGGTFYDYSGNGNSATLQPWITSVVSGKVGTYAPYFSRNQPNYLSLAAAPTITVPFSVNAWVKVNSPSGSYTRIIENDYSKDFYLGLDSTLTKYSFVVKGTFCTGGTTATGTWPNVPWQMVTGTFDGTTALLYVNGTQVASCTPSSPGTQTLGTEIGYCYISGYCSSSTGAWDGQIGSIRLYGRLLSAAEIAIIYSAEKN